MVFSDIREACDATTALRANSTVDAVEIFDRRSLRLANDRSEMVRLSPEIASLPEHEEGAALLIECRGEDRASLLAAIDEVNAALVGSGVPVVTESGYTQARAPRTATSI
eukprot:1427207-Prymnesium_polylepis.1